MNTEGVVKLKDGGELAYSDYPGKGDPIVLIHGFPLNQKIWAPQIEALTRSGRRVITYDMRGFGKSSDPTGPYSHEEDLKQLFETLNLKECHLVGMSFGGEIATSFAISNPATVKELTLIGSGINGYRPHESAPFGDWARLAREGRLDEVKQQILGYGELGQMKEKDPILFGRISEIIGEYKGFSLRGDKRILPNPPIIERLGEVKCKTHVIVGLNDSLDSLEQTLELANKIPKVELETVVNVGHFVNLEKPEIVNQSLLNSEIKKEKEPVNDGIQVIGEINETKTVPPEEPSHLVLR